LGKGVADGHAENTIGSFAAALEAGLTWLEADARSCGDGTLVVAHDPTAPDGRFFVDMTGAEAESYGVLSLEGLLAWLPQGVGLDLDVKTSLEDAAAPRDETTAARMAPHAAREQARRPLIVTSFDPAALLILRERAPEVAIGLLTWLSFPLRKAVPAAVHLGCDVVVAHWASFGPNSLDSAPVHREPSQMVEVAHEVQLEVVAWGPDAGEASHLLEVGLDAVIVNDAPGVLAALKGPR